MSAFGSCVRRGDNRLRTQGPGSAESGCSIRGRVDRAVDGSGEQSGGSDPYYRARYQYDKSEHTEHRITETGTEYGRRTVRRPLEHKMRFSSPQRSHIAAAAVDHERLRTGSRR